LRSKTTNKHVESLRVLFWTRVRLSPSPQNTRKWVKIRALQRLLLKGFFFRPPSI